MYKNYVKHIILVKNNSQLEQNVPNYLLPKSKRPFSIFSIFLSSLTLCLPFILTPIIYISFSVPITV